MSKPLTIEEFNDALNNQISVYKETNDPIPEVNERSFDKISSYLEMPFQTGYGQELYPDIYDKAAILCYLIIKNHPLSNGNKRMGIISMLLFLEKNNVKHREISAYSLAKHVASSDSNDKDNILQYIKDKITPMASNKKEIEKLKKVIADSRTGPEEKKRFQKILDMLMGKEVEPPQIKAEVADSTPKRSHIKKVKVFKKTKDSDLKKGDIVAYKDVNGEYSKTGEIARIEKQDGILLYGVKGGSYTADELKLVEAKPSLTKSKMSISKILGKTKFSDGLKESLVDDFEASGHGDVTSLIGKDDNETDANIKKNVRGFSSGKNTYLQSKEIAKVIHKILFESKRSHKKKVKEPEKPIATPAGLPSCDELIEKFKVAKKARLERQKLRKDDSRKPDTKLRDEADKKMTDIINKIIKLSKKDQLSKRVKKDVLEILREGITHVSKA